MALWAEERADRSGPEMVSGRVAMGMLLASINEHQGRRIFSDQDPWRDR
jgi:hypothetical protein